MAISGLASASIAGSFGALASLFTKATLSGSSSQKVLKLFVDDIELASEVLRVTSGVVVILCSILMWVMITRAYANEKSTAKVNVIAGAANLLTTGILGKLVFEEILDTRWLVGAVLIVVGSVLISQNDISSEANDAGYEKPVTRNRKSKGSKAL